MSNREEEESLLPSLFVFPSRITSISASWRRNGASDEEERFGVVWGEKDQHSASRVRDVASGERRRGGRGIGERIPPASAASFPGRQFVHAKHVMTVLASVSMQSRTGRVGVE